MANDTEDTIEVSDETDSTPKEEEPKYEADENIVFKLKKTEKGKVELKRILDDMCEDYSVGWDATEPYRQRVAKDWELIAGILPPKQAPFENCANLHVPTALENIMRVYTRCYEELFGDWTNVFGVVPVGPGDEELADVLTLHSNWQLREQIRDFPRQMHRGLMSFFFIGDVTGHSWYDPMTRLNRHEVLTPDDFLVPYTSVTTQPDYSDVPWTVKILRMYDHELLARVDEWDGVEELLEMPPPEFDTEPSEPLAKTATESSEQQIDDAQRVRPYKLISYEGWCELPGEKRPRFVKAIIEPEKRVMLSLTLHEQENWQDRIRYDYQMLELSTYESALANRQLEVEQLRQQQSLIEEAQRMGEGGPLNNAAMHGNLEEVISQIPMPPMPTWLTESESGRPEPIRMEPIRMFVHAVCIEPLKGNLGLSYGRIQSDHNRAINQMLSQFVDSASFANVPCYIGSAGLRFEGGFEYAPGKVNYSNLTPEQLQKGIIPIPTQPPSPALFQTTEMMMGVASSSMQSPNVLSGEPGKSGETARGLAARIEQASKQLGTMTRKFMNEFVQPIVKNNAYLNSQFLAEDELVQITNHAVGRVVPAQIKRSMYERNYAIVFRADLRFTSQAERVSEADEITKMVLSIPMLAQNPALVYEAVRKSFQARGLYQMIALLGKAPPAPPVFGQPMMPPPGQQPGQQPQQGQPNGQPNGQPMQQGMA